MSAVAILGAAGTIGPAIVRDLAESSEADSLVLLDLDAARAAAVAAEHGGDRATSVGVDASDPDALAAVLQAAGVAVLVNAASYRLNLAVMDAALAAGCHYLDLGGQQLERHDRFAAIDRTAVLGMGASPGKTNLRAALGAADLDEVHALHVSAAATDPTPPGHTGLSAPYAIETILDELTLPAIAITNGQAAELPALTDGGELVFPEPIGPRRSVHSLYSELATFPTSFPGLREASFRLSLAPALADRVELLARCGLADLEPLELADGRSVRPRTVLLASLAWRGATVPPSNRTTAVHMVDVSGVRGGEAVTARIAAVTVPHEGWGLGGGVVSTAAPAAEGARRLLQGDVAGPGVLPPERAFDPSISWSRSTAPAARSRAKSDISVTTFARGLGSQRR